MTAPLLPARIERSLTLIRLGGLGVAAFDAGFLTTYPSRAYEVAGFLVATLATAGTIGLGLLARRDLDAPAQRLLGRVGFVHDFLFLSAFVVIYQFEPGAPIRQVMLFVVAEGAVRWAMRGALVSAAGAAVVLAAAEAFRASRDFGNPDFVVDHVVLPALVLFLTGAILGWLVSSLRAESARATARAAEAEVLRDRVGRRADILDATNRCARALASSLELQDAFAAFARELTGLLPYDRVSLVMAQDHGEPRVLAVAGANAETVLPQGASFPATPLVKRVLDGETVYREDMADGRYPEELEPLGAGVGSRVLAPLSLGPIPIGLLAVGRAEPRSFSQDEIELTTLVARVVASAVQNIRAYAVERATADELRRLSSLRADFVSLVSHELRSPMAAVIGAARTLHERWRELRPDQRESFLTLIADETQRLADLIGDVLDTSRIEAGTFSYRFAGVDLEVLVRDLVATAQLGQEDVLLVVRVNAPLPSVQADEGRIRQILRNLLDNAVKYSPEGAVVSIEGGVEGPDVVVTVTDSGPGVSQENQSLVFEKFGRTKIGGAKPGTGLGLFIARSIAEAHGGSLELASQPGAGATFTLRLPAELAPARHGQGEDVTALP